MRTDSKINLKDLLKIKDIGHYIVKDRTSKDVYWAHITTETKGLMLKYILTEEDKKIHETEDAEKIILNKLSCLVEFLKNVTTMAENLGLKLEGKVSSKYPHPMGFLLSSAINNLSESD